MNEELSNFLEATSFLDELPKRIEWLKEPGMIKEDNKSPPDKEYYPYFFNIWSEMRFTPELQFLARKAADIVYSVLLEGKPMYKHYENCMSYQMSEDACKIYWVACDIYNYVIWLQAKDRFPDKTRVYCEKIASKWLK